MKRVGKKTSLGDAFKNSAVSQRQEVRWALEVFFSLSFLNRRDMIMFKT